MHKTNSVRTCVLELVATRPSLQFSNNINTLTMHSVFIHKLKKPHIRMNELIRCCWISIAVTKSDFPLLWQLREYPETMHISLFLTYSLSIVFSVLASDTLLLIVCDCTRRAGFKIGKLSIFRLFTQGMCVRVRVFA